MNALNALVTVTSSLGGRRPIGAPVTAEVPDGADDDDEEYDDARD